MLSCAAPTLGQHSHELPSLWKANRAGAALTIKVNLPSTGLRVRRAAHAVWDAYFGGYKTAILGLGGSTVEELTYRLLSGHERLERGPRVIILLIGGRGQACSLGAAADRPC